jgi:hypothetical protein
VIAARALIAIGPRDRRAHDGSDRAYPRGHRRARQA